MLLRKKNPIKSFSRYALLVFFFVKKTPTGGDSINIFFTDSRLSIENLFNLSFHCRHELRSSVLFPSVFSRNNNYHYFFELKIRNNLIAPSGPEDRPDSGRAGVSWRYISRDQPSCPVELPALKPRSPSTKTSENKVTTPVFFFKCFFKPVHFWGH